MAKYIHWGATTQDIMDDASILQMKRGLELVGRELQTLVGVLKGLAEKYRDTYVYMFLSIELYANKPDRWPVELTFNTPFRVLSVINALSTCRVSCATKSVYKKSSGGAY